MFGKSIEFVKANKEVLIRKGTIVAGVLAGIIITAIIVNRNGQNDELVSVEPGSVPYVED
jgi:hypothetical protein